MIRNVIFDFGGVLLDLRPDRCIAQFTALGMPQITSMLSMAHQQGVLDAMERGELTLSQFCDAMRATMASTAGGAGATGDASAQPTNRQIIQAYCSMADGVPPYRLDAVAGLRAEGYHVAALSNTNPVHWGYCQRYFIEAGHEPRELFEHVWLSSDLGLVKPDPEIFRLVLRRSGYVPAETLFVDDNATNCAVAGQFGIQTFCPPVRTDWRADLRRRLAGL